MLNPETILKKAQHPGSLVDVLTVLGSLREDAYSRYLSAYLTEGISKFGSMWNYTDILGVLIACSSLIQPRSYLEIGVRRGRSMAMVAFQSPETDLYGFDSWEGEYAGMDNPGPEFVQSEMRSIGARGKIDLVKGNSHETLPVFFSNHPDLWFDLITVDGDHSFQGAKQDLMDVLPRVKIGGSVIFDDIVHPDHPYLLKIWEDSLKHFGQFKSSNYTDLGYGVSVAICTG